MAVSTTLGDQASCLGSDESADMGFPGVDWHRGTTRVASPARQQCADAGRAAISADVDLYTGPDVFGYCFTVASWITEMPARVPAACAGRIVDCRAGTAPAARGGGVR